MRLPATNGLRMKLPVMGWNRALSVLGTRQKSWNGGTEDWLTTLAGSQRLQQVSNSQCCAGGPTSCRTPPGTAAGAGGSLQSGETEGTALTLKNSTRYFMYGYDSTLEEGLPSKTAGGTRPRAAMNSSFCMGECVCVCVYDSVH